MADKPNKPSPTGTPKPETAPVASTSSTPTKHEPAMVAGSAPTPGRTAEPAAGFSTPGGQPLSAQPTSSAPNPIAKGGEDVRPGQDMGPASSASDAQRASGAPTSPINAPASALTTGENPELQRLHDQLAQERAQLAQERTRRQESEAQLARIDDLIKERFNKWEAERASGAPTSPINAPASADADKVLVVNVGAAPIYVPDVVLPDGRALTLSPGINPLPKATWEQAKRRRTIQRFLSAGAHLLATSGLREAGAGDIAQLSQDQALLLMSTATDPEQLEQWLQAENRPMVKAAGERQREILRQRHAQIAEQMGAARAAGEVKTARRIG